ncbi:MAG TPA: hypothetical protein VJ765_09690, partial [Chitinophagaceae bacterium]|nr:hypothetical protein [Chitinophagaceae bacterium]
MISKHISFLAIFLICLCRVSLAQFRFWEQTNGPTGGSVMSITMDNNRTLFCGTQGGTLFQFKENDQVWKPLFLGATRDNVIAIVIDQKKRIFFGTTSDGLFRCSEETNTWEKINTGLKNPQITGLVILPDGTLFAGTTTGLYKSTNSGNNWIREENLDNRVNTIIVHHQIIYVAYDDGLVSYSKDGGQNWKRLPLLKNMSITCLLSGNDQQLYASTRSGDVFQTKISNPDWKKITRFG